MKAKLFFFVSLIALCASLLYWLTQLPYFRIAEVSIHTADGVFHHANQRNIYQALLPTLSSSFFNINLQKAEEITKQQQWVQSAQVSRVLPNKVMVNITEYTPKARWIRDNVQAGLITEEGEIFQAQFNEQLPELDGEEQYLKEMLTSFQVFQNTLKSLHLSIKRLQYTSRGAWTLVLDNGVEVRLGKNDIHTRLANFTKVWASELQSQVHNIDYVDMRYKNGAAVGWLNEATSSENIKNNLISQPNH